MVEKKLARRPAGFSLSANVALRSTDAMDEQELHQRARQAFEAAGSSQRDVARALDLNRSSVSRALRNAGLKHAAVQARIVSILEGTPVQRRSTYDGADVHHEWIVAP
jgi:DNA invertase Pin-like site-specific DNA recombinase